MLEVAQELKCVCHERDVKCIKLGKLTWAGHVFRMEESDPAKKVFCAKPGGKGDRRGSA
jgi:hypothetical protein